MFKSTQTFVSCRKINVVNQHTEIKSKCRGKMVQISSGNINLDNSL